MSPEFCDMHIRKLEALEARTTDLQISVAKELIKINMRLDEIMEQNAKDKPTMQAINDLVATASVVRWAAIGGVGMVAALASFVASWAVISKWWSGL